MNFEIWDWAVAILAAVLVGLSKTGISGLGMLSVVLFAQILPAKQATGLVLPLLCFGDLVAVASYRRHATWHLLWRLFPWTALGVVIGYLALGRINEQQTRWLIGGIVLALVGLHLVRRRRQGGEEAEHGAWFAPTIGILAGFTTLVANAAGPLMVIYLLAMRLPKLEFMGTGAVFFMLLNLFKVPFMVHLGLINSASFGINLLLAPAVFGGAWVGRKLLHRINQRVFENLALFLSAAAALELMFKFSSHLRIALASASLWRG
ncbi:sulfite exporter TauE/SafE family protein [Opitutus sp. ER46]|uniref:sulfite exporter TauE/SafE family protein n=1 Tax=Opitutus sp. ER46 TaxID=2161864 RepID=UPI000D314A0F|nr:sulfite exporter TauE/SafE family protein [Opitutus sp. ER46]PTX90820.1 sulfite exporter TauE/SafE family protein [Opitutus sp. ER46]